MGWETALASVGEFASRNLCRPGCLELWVVLCLLLAATCCGCLLRFDWGLAAGYGIAKYDLGWCVGTPIKVVASELGAAGKRRLSFYNVKRG